MINIDCPNYVRFPSNIYHHISTNKSHTVRPIGDQPQFHLIVIQMPNTPTDDVDIKQLWLKNRRGETVPDSFWEWYGGAQVFNVFLKDHMLRRQLSILADMLVDSMVHRKMIQRGVNIPSEGNITSLCTGVGDRPGSMAGASQCPQLGQQYRQSEPSRGCRSGGGDLDCSTYSLRWI